MSWISFENVQLRKYSVLPNHSFGTTFLDPDVFSNYFKSGCFEDISSDSKDFLLLVKKNS